MTSRNSEPSSCAKSGFVIGGFWLIGGASKRKRRVKRCQSSWLIAEISNEKIRILKNTLEKITALRTDISKPEFEQKSNIL